MSNQSKKTKTCNCNYVCNGISTCKEIEKKKIKTVLLEVVASRILFLLSAQIFCLDICSFIIRR